MFQSDVVLVELILHDEIVSYTFVQCLNLMILGLKLIILALVNFQELLKLKLQKGHIIAGLLIAQAKAAIFICYLKVPSKFVSVTRGDVSVDTH